MWFFLEGKPFTVTSFSEINACAELRDMLAFSAITTSSLLPFSADVTAKLPLLFKCAYPLCGSVLKKSSRNPFSGISFPVSGSYKRSDPPFAEGNIRYLKSRTIAESKKKKTLNS